MLTVTSDADSGMGSLRDTVAAAQNGDTINFDQSLNGHTITLTSGQIDITTNLTIDGPGADQLTISGNQASSIFVIPSGSPLSVTITGLTLQDGSATDRFGGAIDDPNVGGTLSVSSCAFNDNLVSSLGTDGEIAGGAIYSRAQLSVDHCTFTNNQVRAVAAPAQETSLDFCSGGAIEEDGDTLTITNSTFEQNNVHGADDIGGGGGYGGAVAMRSSLHTISATLTGNTFKSNTASGGNSDSTSDGGAASGGAVYILSNAQKGTVELSDDTFGGDGRLDGNSAYGGNGRYGGSAEGGSITLDGVGSKAVHFDVFNTHVVQGSVNGGNSVGGTPGDGGVAFGGAIALRTGKSVANGNSTGAFFALEQVTCMHTRAYGGECGDSTDVHAPLYRGGDAYGGGVYFSTSASRSPHLVVVNCQFFDDIASGGLGGSAPAVRQNRNRPLTSFAGGNAYGGGLAISVGASQSPEFTIADTTFDTCNAQGGKGGHGANSAAPNTFFNGGPGGKALGGGMAFLNGPSMLPTLIMRNCKFLTNFAQGGTGGDGGDQGMIQDGGDGGIGGAASGGGLEIQCIGGNTGVLNDQALLVSITGSAFSVNSAIGGLGGKGGVGLTGGAGGSGGRAQGGGVDINSTNGNPLDVMYFDDDLFVDIDDPAQTSNVAQGGHGGGGGQGLVALGGAGGTGGLGAGGAISSQFSLALFITDGQITRNKAAGGAGGTGGDNNGADGDSNHGYGGGIWAHNYTVGGADLWTGNLIIDMNVADVNPDVDGIFTHY